MKEYFYKLYSNKLENLEEIDNFLDAHNLPKFIHEDISQLRRSITSNEIEAIVKNLPTRKNPGPEGFPGDFYETFKEELTPMLLKLVCKIEREGWYQAHSMNLYYIDNKTR
jgi:hypothetical protein